MVKFAAHPESDTDLVHFVYSLRLSHLRSFLKLTDVGLEDEGMYTCLVGGSNKALWREVSVRGVQVLGGQRVRG